MPFHQLWEGSRVRSASFDLLSGLDYSSVSTEDSTTFVERPHVNFDAIHALQGSSVRTLSLWNGLKVSVGTGRLRIWDVRFIAQ